MEVLQSCSVIRRKNPDLPSGYYNISPMGYGGSSRVHCDMSSKNGIGVTEIGHNSEQRTKVVKYESAGSYQRKIVYKAHIANLAALTKLSNRCGQFIKWECVGAMIMNNGYGWWVSRQGAKMRYWGGATGHAGKCACAMSKSCAGGENCNCDMNDNVLRKDEGYLTDKNTLPVTELRFGDTGGVWSSNREHGYYTLGKLLCWG